MPATQGSRVLQATRWGGHASGQLTNCWNLLLAAKELRKTLIFVKKLFFFYFLDMLWLGTKLRWKKCCRLRIKEVILWVDSTILYILEIFKNVLEFLQKLDNVNTLNIYYCLFISYHIIKIIIVPLAYMSAVVHNLPDLATPLKSSITENLPDIKFDFDSFSLIPAKPAFPEQHPICINNLK